MRNTSKFALIAACLTLLSLLFTGCGAARYQDGVYTAASPEFSSSGWKEILELTVEDGKITKVNWDAIFRDESIPIRKKQYSKSGLYGMLAGGASDEWYDQALAAEQFVLENGVDAMNMDDGGHTDAVSGCSISVKAFDTMMRECLAQASK